MLFALVLSSCRQQMADQPRYGPLQASDFFADGRSARPLVPGTLPRGALQADVHLYTGKLEETDPPAVYAESFPVAVTRAMLERGHERFDIYCAVCHDRLGTGQGAVVRRGLIRPPSFHQDQSRGLKIPLRDAPVGYYFEVITRGFGAMPDYAEQIPVRDRWAIIAYVRALQLSQHAALEDIPPADRDRLESGDDR
jgi:mono/diheme cytochrome c family protein